MYSTFTAIAQATGSDSSQDQHQPLQNKKPAWLKKLGPAIKAVCQNPSNQSEASFCQKIEAALQECALTGSSSKRDRMKEAAFELVKNKPLRDDEKVAEIENVAALWTDIFNETSAKCDESKYYQNQTAKSKICRHSFAKELGFKV
jgi:hypothetical protein